MTSEQPGHERTAAEANETPALDDTAGANVVAAAPSIPPGVEARAAAGDAVDADRAGEQGAVDDDAEATAARDAGAPASPDEEDLPARIESLLFVSDGAVEESVLGRVLGVTRRRLDRGLDTLAAGLRESSRGVRLQRGPDGAQLVTAPESAALVEYFLGLEAARRLSTAALETLAIVAYRQPVTRGTIELIRGVSSDAALATLRARGLITEGGRAEGPGRPVLWVTTQRFLQHFGLERPSDLPPLPADVELPEENAGAQLTLDPMEGAAHETPAAAPLVAEGETPDGNLEALSQAAGAVLGGDRATEAAPAGDAEDASTAGADPLAR